MTLLELYEGVLSDKIEFRYGICRLIAENVSGELSSEFSDIMCERIGYIHDYWNGRICLPNAGEFTTERETFLLLFAAYKGEL